MVSLGGLREHGVSEYNHHKTVLISCTWFTGYKKTSTSSQHSCRKYPLSRRGLSADTRNEFSAREIIVIHRNVIPSPEHVRGTYRRRSALWHSTTSSKWSWSGMSDMNRASTRRVQKANPERLDMCSLWARRYIAYEDKVCQSVFCQVDVGPQTNRFRIEE